MQRRTTVGGLLFVRLLRKWSAARASGENPVPHMHAAAGPFEPSPDLAIACASLFELVEAHLERQIVPECCCSKALSCDEEALIGLLLHAPEAGQPFSSHVVPHGLPGALRWAAFAVTRALAATFDGDGRIDVIPSFATSQRGCPFGAPRGAMKPSITAIAAI